MKNIGEWVEWMTRNPKLAEKYYPEITQRLNDRIKSSEPYLTALIIQKLPDHFPNWKTEAEKYFGIKRTKMIQGYIDLIKVVLIQYEYPSEIEQKAVESVRAELTEQLDYWEKKLKTLPPQKTETKADKLKVKQIALIHFYEGKQITRANAGDIAAKYGYMAKNSGEGLFQDYNSYCSAANRKGKPTHCTPKRLNNKIELFESVVNYLSDINKQRAIDEINILKTIYENEYQ